MSFTTCKFGFRKKHSTPHTLIHLTNKIGQQPDSGNFDRGIFIDLQEAFETVDHEIIMQKLNHYGIRMVTNNWFLSYLQNQL